MRSKRYLLTAKYLCLALSLAICLWQGCSGDTAEQFNLTYQERALIDTIYLTEVSKLRPQLDSLCLVRNDSLTKRLLDSLLIERRAEEAKLRQRMIERGLINKNGTAPQGVGQ